MEKIYKYLASLIALRNRPTPAGEHFHEIAVWHIGKDVAPTQNELGCAEAVNSLCIEAFGDVVGGDLSSYRMYLALKNNRKFIEVQIPRKGDIIISPTGFANFKSDVKHGHVGILDDNRKIMSNDSETGKWLDTYTIWSWTQRYKIKGGYFVKYYRRLTF